eukprot:COSAG01_NODE_14377_length_1461_cov_16.746696_1_plen_143_part_00
MKVLCDADHLRVVMWGEQQQQQCGGAARMTAAAVHRSWLEATMFACCARDNKGGDLWGGFPSVTWCFVAGGKEGLPPTALCLPVCLSVSLSSVTLPTCALPPPWHVRRPGIGVLPCRPLPRPFGSPELLAMPGVGGEVMVID